MCCFRNSFLVFVLVFSLFNAEVLSTFGYHKSMGIKRATELRSSEVLIRIVGGTQSSLSAFPFQAGIVVKLTTGWTSICGGTLISNRRLLTAAHCWWDGQSQAVLFTIVLGSLTIFSGGTRIDTRDVTVHPSWNVADILYDIAVVRISAVTFNNNIQSVPLPSVSDVNRDFAGLTATASGYGKTNDAQTAFPATTSLRHTSLPIITNAQCQASYDIPIHASHLCTSGAGGIGTCDGDSGGPLTVIWNNQRTLVGIVSFGLSNGCQHGYPSVFSRVTSFINWIQANM